MDCRQGSGPTHGFLLLGWTQGRREDWQGEIGLGVGMEAEEGTEVERREGRRWEGTLVVWEESRRGGREGNRIRVRGKGTNAG